MKKSNSGTETVSNNNQQHGSCRGDSTKLENHQHREEEFATQTMVLKCQKKLASKLSSRYLMKFFVNEPTGRIFDNVHRLLFYYTNSRHLAGKLMKDLIKLNIKISLLFFNNVLNDDEIENSNDFRDCFYKVCDLLLRSAQCRGMPSRQARLVECLSARLARARHLLLTIVARHLSPKSRTKICNCAEFLLASEFLGRILSGDQPFCGLMDQIRLDLQDIMDRGLI